MRRATLTRSRLDEIRARAHYKTLTELAKASGLSRQLISSVWNSGYIPSDASLSKLAAALYITPSELEEVIQGKGTS